MKGKKGQAVLYITFFISALIIIVIAAVLAPMGVQFSTVMFTEGESILANAQPDIDAIQDTDIQAAINASVASAKEAGSTNIQVNSAMYQYAWVLVIILAGVIFFLQTRRLIEVGAGGFV